MAFKFIALSSLLALAQAGVVPVHTYSAGTAPASMSHGIAYAHAASDAVATTHQNVVRNFDGTVSSYSKMVDTPYSSVHKQDTRISNNVYTPAIAKTVSYAAPAPVAHKTIATHAAPKFTKTLIAPVPTVAAPPATYYTHATAPAPTVISHVAATPSAALYTHVAPAVPKTVAYAAPAATAYNHGPAATTYTHNAAGVSGYGSSQTVHYSPAEMVSHMSFEGFGTHWGY